FSRLDGDKLVTSDGRTIAVPRRPPPTDGGGDRAGGDFTGQGVDPNHPTVAPTPGDSLRPTFVAPTLTRVDVDFDGDGADDGYVLVGMAGHAPSPGDEAIVVTGRTLGGGEAFG
ncbi:MAG TPA: hypothetical protein VJU34_10310, partial [Phenylobacterium sp.]|nr:hypothetical protein [Phenylobacterium sp.]